MTVKTPTLRFPKSAQLQQPKTQAAPQEQKNHKAAQTSAPALSNIAPQSRARVWMPIVLDTLRKIPNYTVAAKAAGVSRQAVMQRRQNDHRFADLCSKAIEQGVESLEAHCWKRASTGWTRPIFQRNSKGDPVQVGEEQLFDGRLAEVLLRAHAPHKYNPKVQAEVSGPNGQPLVASAAPIHCTFVLPQNFRDDPAHRIQAAKVEEDTKQLTAPAPAETP